jgi:hypothetical protein
MANTVSTRNSLKREMEKIGVVGFSCTGKFSTAEKRQHLAEIGRRLAARKAAAVRQPPGRCGKRGK